MRWTAKRKLEVADFVKDGKLKFDVAVKMFDLTTEELQGWLVNSEKHGIEGVKNKNIKAYRNFNQ